MMKGKDGLWRTVGGIVVSAEQQKELDAMGDQTPYQRVLAGEFDNPVEFKPGASAEDRRERRESERQMTEKFRRVLEEDHGLTEHPKRDLLWRLAWEDGHSSGYGEVALVYERLADLLKS